MENPNYFRFALSGLIYISFLGLANYFKPAKKIVNKIEYTDYFRDFVRYKKNNDIFISLEF